MNKVYRIVFNVLTGRWVVASEVAKSRGKAGSTPRSSRGPCRTYAVAAFALAAVGLAGVASAAQPGRAQGDEAPAAESAQVAGFRVVPAASPDETKVRDVLAAAAGPLGAPPHTLDDVARWSDALTQALRQGGFPIGQVLVTDADWRAHGQGAPVFTVFPGRVHAVVVKNTSRMHDDRLQRLIEKALCDSDSVGASVCLVQTARLERATQLLQDLPGVVIDQAPQFSPGAGVGEVDVTFSLAQNGKPAQIGFVVDNKGMDATGTWRAGVTASGNNHFGLGESYAASVMFTQHGMWTGSVSGSVPVLDNGLRAGAGFSREQYAINAGTPVDGVSNVGQLELAFPVKRGLDRNVWASASLLHGNAETTYRDFDVSTRSTLDSARFQLQADNGDRARQLRGNLWNVQGALTLGRQRNDDPADVVVQREGQYAKATVSASGRRLLDKDGDWFVTARANAQVASRNLDPSEKLLFGGPDAVRAYRSDEGSFDDGAIANVGVYRRLPVARGNQLQLGGFVDVARGRINHAPWEGWERSYVGVDDVTNWRTLAGAGVSVDWLTSFGATVSFSAARAFPSASPSWIDDKPRDTQLWLTVGWNR